MKITKVSNPREHLTFLIMSLVIAQTLAFQLHPSTGGLKRQQQKQTTISRKDPMQILHADTFLNHEDGGPSGTLLPSSSLDWLDEGPNLDGSTDAGSLYITQSSSLVDSSPPSTPNTPNYELAMKRFRGMIKSASINSQRMTHAVLGTASLSLGFFHLVSCCIHGFGMPLDRTDVLIHGVIHTACAVMGMPRLDLNSRQDRTRNLCIAPIFFQNAWLTTSMLTEWVEGPDCLISMDSGWMTMFTVTSLLGYIWQLVTVSQVHNNPDEMASGLWFDTPLKNVSSVFANFIMWNMLLICFYFYVTVMPLTASYSDLVAQYPDFGWNVANVTVDMMFFNNFVIFLLSIFKYKVFQRSEYATLVPILGSVILTEGAVMPSLREAGNGEAYGAFLQLLSQPFM